MWADITLCGCCHHKSEQKDNPQKMWFILQAIYRSGKGWGIGCNQSLSVWVFSECVCHLASYRRPAKMTEVTTLRKMNERCSEMREERWTHGDRLAWRPVILRQCVPGMYNYQCVCVWVLADDREPLAGFKWSASTATILIMTTLVTDKLM